MFVSSLPANCPWVGPTVGMAVAARSTSFLGYWRIMAFLLLYVTPNKQPQIH